MHFGSLSIFVAGTNTHTGRKSNDTFSPKKGKVHVYSGSVKVRKESKPCVAHTVQS